jgi:hypothetical protein
VSCIKGTGFLGGCVSTLPFTLPTKPGNQKDQRLPIKKRADLPLMSGISALCLALQFSIFQTNIPSLRNAAGRDSRYHGR